MKINNKKLLALLLAGGISLSHIPHTSGEIKTEGDKIAAQKIVNIRDNNGLDGEIIGKIKKNYIAKRICSYDNGWSLIEYNARLGFVKDEFFQDISDNNTYCDLEFTEMRKILLTKNVTSLRFDPYDEAMEVTKVGSNMKVMVMAYTSNGWYLVNVNHTLGFVREDELMDAKGIEQKTMVVANSEVNVRSKASAKSPKYNIMYQDDAFPFIREEKDFYVIDYYGTEAYVVKRLTRLEERPIQTLDYLQLVYFNNDSLLFSEPSPNNIVGYVGEYQTGEILSDVGDYYLVQVDEQLGYVHKSNINKLKGMVVVVDLSKQKLYLYENSEVLLETNVVTGKNASPTYIKKDDIDIKERERLLIGENYECFVNYWVQYDGNYGIHDYDMNGNYGGDIYKKKGSHGCIRMHIIPMEKFYELVKKKTPIIIHE